MKHIFLISILCTLLYQVQAQKTATIHGQINHYNSSELIYLGMGENLFPLKLSTENTFALTGSIQETPSFLYLANISKRGKIEQQTPLIWFEDDSVKISIDWVNKSFQLQNSLPFQATSEKIETLKGKAKTDYILTNPNTFAGIYFAYTQRKNISLTNLERFSQQITKEYENAVYVKRIENYIAAKRREAIKKGNPVENFTLPDKQGNQVSVISPTNQRRLISLFSSGCSYSIASISLLEQLAQLNKNNIELITIWDDPTRDTWLTLQQDKKEKITWTNLWDEFGFASTYLNRTMWPTFYVINEQGELTEIIKGYNKSTAKRLKQLVE
jgi:cytochrome oxidase Cu insertion factor (SCO1/SenC/PrrC family)